MFTAALNILLLEVGGDDVSATFYCFIVAIGILGLCLIAFFLVTRTTFYQYYVNKSETPDLDETSPLISSSLHSSTEISVGLRK